MKTFDALDGMNAELIAEYNELCAKGHGLSKHEIHANKLTLHHILPRCMFPDDKDNEDNWTWLSFEDHWLAHYLLWKATGLPAYASAFWFICVYGMKNRGMTMPANEYERLKKDVAMHHADTKKRKANERIRAFRASRQRSIANE